MNHRLGFAAALTPQEFYSLAALARRPMHAYGLIQDVEHDSEGMVTMARQTVKGVLVRQLAAGRVQAVPSLDPFAPHKRGATYQLTPLGQRILKQELRRLSRAVTIGNYSLHYGQRYWHS